MNIVKTVNDRSRFWRLSKKVGNLPRPPLTRGLAAKLTGGEKA